MDSSDPVPDNAPPRRSRPELLVVLGLVAVGLIIYGRTLRFPFITLDDPGYVVNNPHVGRGLSWEGWRWAWTSFEWSNWHPLTWLSLMLDAQFYGLNAGGYHLTNLLLHLADAILLFWWLRTATGALWPSAWTALFFVIHPMHVESVAWVTERKDVLSTLFFFLTLLAYTRYSRGGGIKWYALALALFALGLTAKPMLVTLPVLLPLLDFWPLGRMGIGWRRLAWEKLPFALLAAASCAVTFAAQRASAVVPLDILPVWHRLAAAMLGYGFYLEKTFWPSGLGIYYPYWHAEWAAAPWLWGAALVGTTVASFRHARRMPWLPVGWCWFAGMLVPVIGVVQVGGQAAADRYTYLPHVGLFIILFWTAAAAIRRWPDVKSWLVGLGAAAALACLALSWRQAGYWHRSDALFEHTVSVVRPTARLNVLLGGALVEAGRADAAERAFHQAWNGGARDTETVATWTALLAGQGRWQEIVTALEPLANDPNTPESVLNNLASALARLGRGDEAVKVYRRCLDLHPDYAMARFGLGEVLQTKGETLNAMGEYEAGLAIQNDWLPALTRLAWLYALDANAALHERAYGLARHAVDVSGGNDLGSLDALAVAAASMGRWDEAVRAAESALDLARRPGAVAGAADLSSARLEMYRSRRLPSR